MKDAGAELLTSAEAWFYGDADPAWKAAIDAALGGPSRIFTVEVEENVRGSYIVLQLPAGDPFRAECGRAGVFELQVDIFVERDPVGALEVRALVLERLAAMTGDLPSFRVVRVAIERVDAFPDINDRRTVHGVVVVSFVTEPL